jgi:hypothetical protein
VNLRIGVHVTNALNITDQHLASSGTPSKVAERCGRVAVFGRDEAIVIGVLGIMTSHIWLDHSNKTAHPVRSTAIWELDDPGVKKVNTLGRTAGVELSSQVLA